ncbi:hypothetical protein VTK73DRAFT_1725 [Phialemonium thermophilum]|uniref:FAD/NAD(P)-binding domain-containing protein n=1 Tax=Phialemonium thermophilum TaxID=223376 RepID=A0ABR3X8U5_9PEZI
MASRALTLSPTSSAKVCVWRKLAPPTGVLAQRVRYSGNATPASRQGFRKERVAILGSGWAGYALARTLDPAKYERIVISPRSYFVFTPLLASSAVGTLEFRAVIEPVRRSGSRLYQGWADDIDFQNKTIRVEANATDDLSTRNTPLLPPASKKGNSHDTGAGTDVAHPHPPRPTESVGGLAPESHMLDVPYDKLVIAVGAYSQTFGIPGVKEHAHFLRDIRDARSIRLRVLSLFEQCSYPTREDTDGLYHTSTTTSLTDDDKRTLLHFAVVGGGPTGIEFAAELHDLINEDLSKIYPELLPLVSITVYDVAPKVLPMFDQALAEYAMENFARQGIAVKTEHHPQRIRIADGRLGREHGAVKIKIKEYGDEEVGAGLVVWSTGLMQNPLVEKLVAKDIIMPDGEQVRLVKDSKTGGIVTDPCLRARLKVRASSDEGSNGQEDTLSSCRVLPDVYVIGDCAILEDNRTLPKTAQVASQQATQLAKNLNKGGDETLRPFKFRNLGTLTYLGGHKAIHQSKANELRGWAAWVLWRTAYLTASMSWRNKIMVPIYWTISWIFGRDISRF